jgi:hypothetical protein
VRFAVCGLGWRVEGRGLRGWWGLRVTGYGLGVRR